MDDLKGSKQQWSTFPVTFWALYSRSRAFLSHIWICTSTQKVASIYCAKQMHIDNYFHSFMLNSLKLKLSINDALDSNTWPESHAPWFSSHEGLQAEVEQSSICTSCSRALRSQILHRKTTQKVASIYPIIKTIRHNFLRHFANSCLTLQDF